MPSILKMGKAIFPDALEDGKCNHFIRPRIIQAAWGLDSLYNEVRLQDANTMKSQVMSLLGGKTSYYRYHRGDKLLTPELQDAVQALFAARGYGKPIFKHYKETIDFTDKEEEKSFT